MLKKHKKTYYIPLKGTYISKTETRGPKQRPEALGPKQRPEALIPPCGARMYWGPYVLRPFHGPYNKLLKHLKL